MINVLVVIIILLSTSYASALSPAIQAVVSSGSSSGCSVSCTGLEICQDFETTVEPCTTCVENKASGSGTETWTLSNSGVDIDYTTVALNGSQSLYLGTAYTATASISDASDVWAFFRFNATANDDLSDSPFQLRNSTTVLAKISLTGTSKVRVYQGTASDDSDTSFSASTETCVWVRITRGVGTNNGTATLYYDSCADVCSGDSCTRPSTAEVSVTAGTCDSGDSDANNILFYGDGTNLTTIDQVYVSIGSETPAFWSSVCND